MPTISRTYPTAWVDRIAPAVESIIRQQSSSEIVQKVMQLRGFSSIDEMTPMEFAETFIDIMVWQATAEFEAIAERDLAYATQMAQALADFTLDE